MAIEIKELFVRFSVVDNKQKVRENPQIVLSEKVIQEIIRKCSEEVLEKMERETDR